jgi:cobalamin synthase
MIGLMLDKRFGCALVLGLVLVALFAAVLLAASIWRLAWNWVDEGESPILENQILAWLYRRVGLKTPEKYSAYKFKTKSGKDSDGWQAWTFPALALLFGPIAVVTVITLYQLSITLLTVYVVAHTARFGRRTMKALKKHVSDPHAHKEAK